MCDECGYEHEDDQMTIKKEGDQIVLSNSSI